VDARLGPGLEGLQQLLQESGPNSFDFAFIDADKGGYQAYFDLCLQLVRPGGCIAVDNVLFYGRVVDPARDDKATVAIRKFNEALAVDDRVDFSIVPIGDGVALCRKR
jgi:predicted O-methyltransferase YrrM